MGLIQAVFPRHRDHADAPAQQLAGAGAALEQSLNSPWLVEAVGQDPGVGLRAGVSPARGLLSRPGRYGAPPLPLALRALPPVPCCKGAGLPLLVPSCSAGARCGSPGPGGR